MNFDIHHRRFVHSTIAAHASKAGYTAEVAFVDGKVAVQILVPNTYIMPICRAATGHVQDLRLPPLELSIMLADRARVTRWVSANMPRCFVCGERFWFFDLLVVDETDVADEVGLRGVCWLADGVAEQICEQQSERIFVSKNVCQTS